MRKVLVRRLAAVGLLVGVGSAVFACSSKADDDLPTQLQNDTGVAWGVAVDPRNNSPRVLTPATPVQIHAGSPEADARAFFAQYGKQLGTGAHDLRVTVDEPELGGGHYVRFQHYLSGTDLRVFDVVSMAHFTAHGAMYVAQPGFRPGLDSIGHDAKLSADDATRAATAAVIASCGADPSIQPTGSPELGVTGDEGLPFALSYRVKFGVLNEQCLAPQFDIDAATGAVLANHAGASSLADRAKGTRAYLLTGEEGDVKPLDITFDQSVGLYRLETESLPKVITNLWTFGEARWGPHGVPITQGTPGNWDSTAPYGPGEAVDSHFGVTQALRYFGEVHGRHGTDGKNGTVNVYVHDDSDDTSGGPNAFERPTYTPFLVFFQSESTDAFVVGDGDYWRPSPGPWMPFSTSFEVLAHEVAHGVTSHTSELAYRGESGALNETFSDVMGISADQWQTPDRHKDPSVALIADRSPRNGPLALRDMITPERYGQPSTTAAIAPCDPKNESPDHCGVHGNSGIGNRAWSLMTLGGTHAKTGVVVGLPMGYEASRVLWYETFTRLRPQSTIGEAALAQINYSWQYDRAHFSTVVCAWAAVNAIWMTPTLPPPPGGAPGLPPLGSVICTTAADAAEPPPDAGTTTAPSTGPCSGKSDGWVCDPAVPYSAYSCNAAKAGGNVTCADTTLRCKPRSPSDPTANVDDMRVLDCE